jgi:hypothetical protein
MMYAVDMTSDGMTIPSFMKMDSGKSSNIKGITSKYWEAVVLILLMRGIFKYTVQMNSGGMIYIPSLIVMVSGTPVILKEVSQRF